VAARRRWTWWDNVRYLVFGQKLRHVVWRGVEATGSLPGEKSRHRDACAKFWAACVGQEVRGFRFRFEELLEHAWAQFREEGPVEVPQGGTAEVADRQALLRFEARLTAVRKAEPWRLGNVKWVPGHTGAGVGAQSAAQLVKAQRFAAERAPGEGA
jgi:hypothetical protein